MAYKTSMVFDKIGGCAFIKIKAHIRDFKLPFECQVQVWRLRYGEIIITSESHDT